MFARVLHRDGRDICAAVHSNVTDGGRRRHDGYAIDAICATVTGDATAYAPRGWQYGWDGQYISKEILSTLTIFLSDQNALPFAAAANYPGAARMVPGQLLLNGMMPQGYMWDMYRHSAVQHAESFREKRERRRKVERTRELLVTHGASSATLQEVKGNVHKLSKDQVILALTGPCVHDAVTTKQCSQAGCRLLQQLLEEADEEVVFLILSEAKAHLCELMTDAFGNYLFQKLLETGTEEQRTMMLDAVSTRMIGAALNLHGTRSVQKLVELCSSTRKQVRICNAQH